MTEQKTEILVTGTSGFIGEALCPFLEKEHYTVTKASIRDLADIDKIDFTNITTVIHLAALVHRRIKLAIAKNLKWLYNSHQMQGAPDSAYMRSNFELTKALADKAKKSGVKKFIFMSTVAVYGLSSATYKLDERTQTNPASAYGKSKLFAEQYLQEINSDDFKINVLRLPLVYGYGAKGNFGKFLSFHAKARLIPFKDIHAIRTMIYVKNLCGLISRLVLYNGPKTVFIATDNNDYSIEQFSKLLFTGLQAQRKVFFVKMPRLLQIILKKLKPKIYQQLFEDLIFDGTNTSKELGYKVPYNCENAIKETCKWYLSEQKKNQ